MKNNSKQLFESVFGKHVNLSSEIIKFLSEQFQNYTFRSRELITEAGAKERYFYLVVSGVQSLYLINTNGEKVILGFSYQGSPSGVFDSFITEKPSTLFIEALTPSEMIGISRDGFSQLLEQFPEFYKWETKFLESILFGRLSREVEMLTFTAKQRFDAFMKRCPKELLDIPQKYLASYLNMTPETFSRMRARRD